MPAEKQGEEYLQKLSRYSGDAIESMTQQASGHMPFCSKAESSAEHQAVQDESIKADRTGYCNNESTGGLTADSSISFEGHSSASPLRLNSDRGGLTPEDSSEADPGEGLEPGLSSSADLDLKAELEIALRRCEMLEAQNSALWQVCNSPECWFLHAMVAPCV